MNKVFFAKLYVDGKETTGHDLNKPFATLYALYEVERSDGAQTSIRAGLPKETGPDDRSVIDLLERSFESGSISRSWWAILGLNQWPLPCQGSALPLS